MGYWGIAFAAGPNYNKSWTTFDPADLEHSVPKCHHVATLAQNSLTAAATPIQKVLIQALPSHYPSNWIPNDFTVANKAYADVMREVYRKFSQDDLNVATLFADALMNQMTRKLFKVRTGKPISNSPVFEVQDVLERGQSPDAEHIWHMPSHIYVLVGNYRHSLDSNLMATMADDKDYTRQGAMLLGHSQAALEAIYRMESTINEDMLRIDSPPMTNWVEFFKSVRVHVYMRFAMWQELKELEIPEDQNLYCVTKTMMHYGKGIAYAATSDIQTAEKRWYLYQQATKRVPPIRLDFPNHIVDILRIATSMLDGELGCRRGNYDIAFNCLRQAIHHDDSIMYIEPWGWMIPTRHAFAALMLEQGHVEEAAQAYAEEHQILQLTS